MQKILILDDETDFLLTTKKWVEKKGYAVEVFNDASGFKESVLEHKPNLILLDVNLKSADGRAICSDLKKTLPFPVKIIMISGSPRTLIEYHYHYADGILNKPFSFGELEQKLKQHLQKL